MNNFLREIESKNISIPQWIIGFIGIIFIRFFIEQFSVKTSSGIITSDSYTLVHYGIFFFLALLAFVLIIHLFTGDGKRALKLGLFGLPVIWLAPLIDLFLSSGQGYTMTYLLSGPKDLIINFLTFFGPKLTSGATIGIRIEIAFILYGIGFFVWQKTKKIVKTVGTVILCYTFLFCMGALPSLVYTGAGFFDLNIFNVSGSKYIAEIISKSSIAHNIFHGSMFTSYGRFLELGFNKLMTQIFFILSFVIAAFYFWKTYPEKFLAVIKNSRLSRLSHYLVLVCLGMMFAYMRGLAFSFVWVDLLGILSLLIGWYGVWMYAVHINDYTDISIDKISNTTRPLITQKLSLVEMWDISYIWLGVALLGTWSAGYHPFFFCLVFLASSYIYSIDFLRLKKFPIISPFLIGVASLVSVLAGFFFASANKSFALFPSLLGFGIVIMYMLGSHIRDLKDVEGDTVGGIYTIPVIFGKEKGIIITGSLFALSFLLVPFFVGYSFLYLISIPASFTAYFLVTKYPTKEKYFFYLYFSYILFGGLLFM